MASAIAVDAGYLLRCAEHGHGLWLLLKRSNFCLGDGAYIFLKVSNAARRQLFLRSLAQ
jgi:hypothetical protein